MDKPTKIDHGNFFLREVECPTVERCQVFRYPHPHSNYFGTFEIKTIDISAINIEDERKKAAAEFELPIESLSIRISTGFQGMFLHVYFTGPEPEKLFQDRVAAYNRYLERLQRDKAKFYQDRIDALEKEIENAESEIEKTKKLL